MNATIEKSLYVGEGIARSRFDLWDEVRITYTNGNVIEGVIVGFEGYDAICLDPTVSTGEVSVSISSIKECQLINI
ncbi:MAG TPA: hypothetical protein IAC14_02575 [Candidatus Scybalomonas excrementigallinarum]|nr:hypothetical protein [Candidatus Scybalomonas excrementigallinarum]